MDPSSIHHYIFLKYQGKRDKASLVFCCLTSLIQLKPDYLIRIGLSEQIE